MTCDHSFCHSASDTAVLAFLLCLSPLSPCYLLSFPLAAVVCRHPKRAGVHTNVLPSPGHWSARPYHLCLLPSPVHVQDCSHSGWGVGARAQLGNASSKHAAEVSPCGVRGDGGGTGGKGWGVGQAVHGEAKQGWVGGRKEDRGGGAA